MWYRVKSAIQLTHCNGFGIYNTVKYLVIFFKSKNNIIIINSRVHNVVIYNLITIKYWHKWYYYWYSHSQKFHPSDFDLAMFPELWITFCMPMIFLQLVLLQSLDRAEPKSCRISEKDVHTAKLWLWLWIWNFSFAFLIKWNFESVTSIYLNFSNNNTCIILSINHGTGCRLAFIMWCLRATSSAS